MCLKKLFDGKGNQHQLDSEKIGDLTKLQTDAKGNLVDAVNEVDGRVPKVKDAQEGSFLRVVNGQLMAVQLTDVSKEGA